MNRLFFAMGLLAASLATAATLTVIPAASLPANAPKVGFENLTVGETIVT
ncbi:MAG: hypothetical protein JWM57_706, partial [Phycisphaerales bacterium]|nr:hypothetical protein [Phycisphaerales bacterium]